MSTVYYSPENDRKITNYKNIMTDGHVHVGNRLFYVWHNAPRCSDGIILLASTVSGRGIFLDGTVVSMLRNVRTGQAKARRET